MTFIWDWDDIAAKTSPGHAELQKTIRTFVDEELAPNIDEWEEKGSFPEDLYERAYKAGVYGAGWPSEYGGSHPASMDAWHKFTLSDELGRLCAGGLVASLFTSGIALPPLLALGNSKQKDKYARDIITGKKLASLAVTEPSGGSDVSGLRTVAERRGDKYIVNGSKTFISGAMRAHYFTTAVRTGGTGFDGISVLMIHRDYPGVKLSRLPTQGWLCSTTTTIAFEDVAVPVENLLGEENQGFLPIMLNFNSERYTMAVSANRMSRCCLEDAVEYARKRKTFGKPLISHQVIRHKCAEMARHILATHGMLITIARSLYEGIDDVAASGQLALAKVQATRTMEFCAREASQILGGKAYLRGQGPGSRIERCYREVRVYAIGGGSEEVMLELFTRQAKL